ncbi:MAG TPA: GNAT family N-acetyltransferase [Pilimelia sp.]|nr:GNAT family N-acetyltransferase [Pilimelia sp.]
MVKVHTAAFAELSPRTLYEILRLRAEVFVIEQECCYQDLDGRDVEDTTRHVWAEAAGEVTGYLRVLTEPDGGHRVGRVVVRRAARGSGVAQRLLAEALRLTGDAPSVLSAQSHLEGFYARFGYRTVGPGFDEDGIPHLPMRRDPTAAR